MSARRVALQMIQTRSSALPTASRSTAQPTRMQLATLALAADLTHIATGSAYRIGLKSLPTLLELHDEIADLDVMIAPSSTSWRDLSPAIDRPHRSRPASPRPATTERLRRKPASHRAASARSGSSGKTSARLNRGGDRAQQRLHIIAIGVRPTENKDMLLGMRRHQTDDERRTEIERGKEGKRERQPRRIQAVVATP